DLGRVGHLGDGDPVEAPGDEQPGGHVGDGLARLLLLALAQPGPGRLDDFTLLHRPSFTLLHSWSIDSILGVTPYLHGINAGQGGTDERDQGADRGRRGGGTVRLPLPGP